LVAAIAFELKLSKVSCAQVKYESKSFGYGWPGEVAKLVAIDSIFLGPVIGTHFFLTLELLL